MSTKQYKPIWPCITLIQKHNILYLFFFKHVIIKYLFLISQDPIVNVCLHLCGLLSSHKSIIKLPGDRVLLQKLEQTVRKLISQEIDPDASRVIRDAVTEMDRIEVAMETVSM